MFERAHARAASAHAGDAHAHTTHTTRRTHAHASAQGESDGSMEQFQQLPSVNTTRRLAAELDAGATLVLHAGDISYARG